MGTTEKLISMVQKYPILYDQSHSEYKNVRAKDRIWMEIGEECNESGEELKKKWKNLRDTYAKYIRGVKKKTEKATTKNKTWVWAHRMEAFRPFLKFAKTVSNESEITSAPGNFETVTVDLNEDVKTENTQFYSENDSVEDTVDTEIQDAHPHIITRYPSTQSPQSSPSALELPDIATPKVPIFKLRTKEKKAKKLSQSLSSIGEVIKYFESKNKRDHDAIDLLMLAHAKTIKTFSGRRQIITKMKIAELIMEQELLHQEELASSQ